MWGLFAGAVALGAIRTIDPTGCVDVEVLDLEVRDLLGDEAADAIGLEVRVAESPSGLVVGIRVVDRGERFLYGKDLPVDTADCPLLPELVARTVALGLADIPFLDRKPRRTPVESAATLRVSAPLPVRAGMGVGVLLPLRGSLRWTADVDGFVTTFTPLGDGLVQVRAVGASTGPTLRLPVGGDSVHASVFGWFGAVSAVGRGFGINRSFLLPRVSVDPTVTFVSRAAVRVGLRAEVPVIRLGISAVGADSSAYEPAFRLGLVLGLGGPLRRREGSADDRP